MFRDDEQRAAVCNAFLEHFGKPRLFASDGASARAIEYAREGYPGSSKEADFFRAAWALWSNEQDIGFVELLGGLDRRSREFLASFVAAEDLEAWLQTRGRR